MQCSGILSAVGVMHTERRVSEARPSFPPKRDMRAGEGGVVDVLYCFLLQYCCETIPELPLDPVKSLGI